MPAQWFATGLPGGVRLLRLLLMTGLCLRLCLPAPALALSDAQQLVVEAWRLVNQSYVDPAQLETVQWRRLRQKALEKSIASSVEAYDAIEAMLAPIGDPYTRMLRPEEFATLRSNTQGRVTGVGLQLGLRAGDQRIVVIAPLDASPAADAGIVSGTEILKVDGIAAEELGLEGTAAHLRGPAGSDVLLALRTPAGQASEVLLDRREVDLQPVRSHRLQSEGHTLGYLRITQFSEPVPQQVRSALAELTAPGGTGPIEGLILDLRNNSGGLVAAGLAVADGLLDMEPIVETQDRGGIAARQQATPGRLYGGPMLTLVNAGTASASEILAGALQDSGRSRLAGSRTFGKGLIQTLINLSDGSGLAVTVARYLTPSGRDIQNQGIEPDVLLPQPEPLEPDGDGDTWRQAAATLLVAELVAPVLAP
ncbi:carboxyl-terminal processing protease CtpZ [Synechococcus sp. CS-1332]|uniref:carboxyl-terminal processing protease CtpZ n=1 Tax=Synechococcus sp. CS-1332 TaxID=2847972 RepID=UPI0029EEA2FF|nr:peptidase S41 [Synechococcus sp. CS-1332]